MKKILLLFIFLTLFLGIGIYNSNQQIVLESNKIIVQAPSSIGSIENPQKRFEYELKKIIDPITGTVPDFIHRKELEFVKKISHEQKKRQAGNHRLKTQDWTSEGPFNVGGRTRVVALDVLNESTILAGGVSGGMWKSMDDGISWTKTSHPATINSSTCLAQDTRPGKENIWYQGTGELVGNSAVATGAPYRGDGIFKSTDNGESWDLLASTSNGEFATFESPFNYVWNIVVNNNRTDIDEVYAAVFGGILRSQDGGSTWTTVLGDDLFDLPLVVDLNNVKSPFFTNIIQTKSGIFYATLSAFERTGNSPEGKGIFRSVDGEIWENISPVALASDHRRIVMDFAISNESILYFFVDGDSPQLWKYDDSAISSNWRNLSFTIPDPSTQQSFDGLDTQTSYNMVVKIHPEDENVVFLGGTNLFRSTDGFTSTDNITRIGGYDLENNGDLYRGHHPDQHNLIFYPSDPDKCISTHDGGLSRTTRILGDQPFWVSLNNGYVTSQFYTVSISPNAGDNTVIGGLQDNGSYAKSVSIENPPWNRVLSGDGGFCATTPNNLFWYFSFQESQIFRVTLNENFDLTSFAQVDPAGVNRKDYLFVNPFILDPNNYNRMYLAGGSGVWRNDNLGHIKSGIQEPTDTNWSRIISSPTIGAQITALDISTKPQNILYFGTETGSIVKVENAHDNPTESQTVLTNHRGYPVCISIDPSNAENLMVLYSNYAIQSIFFSDNGGQTFTDVGGNLEENIDGSGNGPSTRWAEIVPMNDGSYTYFVGTSVGLFSTNSLAAENTLWVKEGDDIIGNSVISMMDYRSSDGTLVVATHGNGIFKTTISETLDVTKETTTEKLIVDNVFPNPFDGQSSLRINFDIPELGQVRIDILNNVGQHVQTLLSGEQFAGSNFATWNGENSRGTLVDDGMYHYRVIYKDEVVTGKILFDQ